MNGGDNNTKPKMKPRKFDDMTQEQIRKAILKKRECTVKAQSIVENLLQNEVTEDHFLQCLVEINREHFQDVIEERSIIHLCGYPLCPQHLGTENIPKQKYRISLKTNKVYDITARKNFCSNSCYKSAMHIKKQMLTSPLWFREYEEIPKFNLLPLDTVGSLGEEIDVNFIEKVIVKEQSVNSKSKNKLDNNKLDKLELNKNLHSHDNISKNESQPSPPSCASSQTKNNIEIENNRIQKSNKTLTYPSNIVGEVIEKPVVENDYTLPPSTTKEAKSTARKTTIPRKMPDIFIITKNVEQCLSEWLSLDTMLLLFGLEKVQKMFTDKGDFIKNYLNNYHNTILYQSNVYDQNELLCRKLNLLELKDKKLDNTLQKESQPLPDYSVLKEESKKIQLKVNAFLSGKTEVEDCKKVEKEDDSKDAILTQLPLVEKHAQNALRRRIVCQHLDKVIPDLMRSLGLLSLGITSDVHALVKTFKLKADNIMFKPIQWTLIAIIVVKLLSIQNRELNMLLQQPSTCQHLQLLLLSYKLDGDYLNRLIMWLTDIDRIIEDIKLASVQVSE